MYYVSEAIYGYGHHLLCHTGAMEYHITTLGLVVGVLLICIQLGTSSRTAWTSVDYELCVNDGCMCFRMLQDNTVGMLCWVGLGWEHVCGTTENGHRNIQNTDVTLHATTNIEIYFEGCIKDLLVPFVATEHKR